MSALADQILQPHVTPPRVVPLEAMPSITRYHQTGQKMVFVSGVFDILHQEHLHFLQSARAAGDVLVVAIESDVRVRQIKGEGRPVNTQDIRKARLKALGFIDIIFVLPEDFSQPAQHRLLIGEVRPAVFAVSSHTSHLDKKRAIVEEFGGKLVVVHEHNPDVSTTLLLAEQPES